MATNLARLYQGGGGRNYAGQVRANLSGMSYEGMASGVQQVLNFSLAAGTVSDSPITLWPEGTAGHWQPDVWNASTTRLRENMCEGQVHDWRISGRYVGEELMGARTCVFQMYNPDSGFEVTETLSISDTDEADFTIYFTTVADPGSLNAGRGYRVRATPTFTSGTFTLHLLSLLRISFAVPH